MDIINSGSQKNPKKEKYRKAVKILTPFCKKDIKKARAQFFFTFIMLYSLIFLNFFIYDINIYLSLLLSPVILVFLCRSQVIVHDCGHQSFFKTRFENAVAGNILAFLITLPYATWEFFHNRHHMYVGNLDKRDLNAEGWTMTVKEYNAAPKFKKILYQFVRSRFYKFLIAPWLMLGIFLRIPNPKFDTKANISVIIYDVLYVIILFLLLSIISFQKLFFIYLIPLLLFYIIDSFIFYVQHQFEDTYWESDDNWSYDDAGFHGSTYLTSPRWFNWVSGNIGSHNIHHLISAIPNYNLRKAQHAAESIFEFKPVSISESFGQYNYKLWSEEKKRLVKFSDINS